MDKQDELTQKKNIDPSRYTEYPDEDHTVRCEWWFNDRKYTGWFKPEDLEIVENIEEIK